MYNKQTISVKRPYYRFPFLFYFLYNMRNKTKNTNICHYITRQKRCNYLLQKLGIFTSLNKSYTEIIVLVTPVLGWVSLLSTHPSDHHPNPLLTMRIMDLFLSFKVCTPENWDFGDYASMWRQCMMTRALLIFGTDAKNLGHQ
jgi:hypothetical protein